LYQFGSNSGICPHKAHCSHFPNQALCKSQLLGNLDLAGWRIPGGNGQPIALQTRVAVCEKPTLGDKSTPVRQKPFQYWFLRLFIFLAGVSLWGSPILSQEQRPDWQTEVRKFATAQDWVSAMSIVDREVARAPQDMRRNHLQTVQRLARRDTAGQLLLSRTFSLSPNAHDLEAAGPLAVPARRPRLEAHEAQRTSIRTSTLGPSRHLRP
jgi:hypothetical protein